MARMDRIVEINTADMTVTVEAGCTWSKLYQALKEVGVRTPFWGPMSGLTSTVGGGLSQLNAMLGAGHYGTSSESVVGLSVVLADGRILRTGTRRADDATPFYRHYGPDLTGLFCGDAGAFGIKAQITLRLIRTPEHEGFASFSFKTGRDLLSAMAEMARAGVASETCAFDPQITRSRMQRASLGADLKTLGAVIGNDRSLVKGLVSAGKMAMAGRAIVPDDEYPLHLIAEGRSAEGVAADLATARSIAATWHGHEIENSVAKVIRAQPFPALNSVLGSKGERWNPIHGIVSLSKAADLFDAVEAVFAEFKAEFDEAGVTIGYLFTTLSTNGLIVEPVFYWPEARSAIHVTAIEPGHLAKLPVHAANPAATALVLRARVRIIALFEDYGCAHFQIGRTYPYRRSRDPAAWGLLTAIKHALDPDSAINPGVLGFDGQTDR
jgi:FAD/FMN-containing dehydrogenase